MPCATCPVPHTLCHKPCGTCHVVHALCHMPCGTCPVACPSACPATLEAEETQSDHKTRAAATQRRRGKPRQAKGTIKQEKLQREGGAGSQGSPRRPAHKRSCNARGAGSQGTPPGQSDKSSCNAKVAREVKAAQSDHQTRETALRGRRGNLGNPKETINQEQLHREGKAVSQGNPKRG